MAPPAGERIPARALAISVRVDAETDVTARLTRTPARNRIDAWSKIVGDFIGAHSTSVAPREGILYVRGLQPALHYELEQISKPEILRKPKQPFGTKTIRDIRFRAG